MTSYLLALVKAKYSHQKTRHSINQNTKICSCKVVNSGMSFNLKTSFASIHRSSTELLHLTQFVCEETVLSEPQRAEHVLIKASETERSER